MTTVYTRTTTAAGASNQNAPLTSAQVDANFINLNNDKEPYIITGTPLQYWRGDKTWQTLDSTTIGLDNVDNTSDSAKPISTATQSALNLKAPLTGFGTSGTWPIAISGNAATASAVAWSGVTGKPAVIAAGADTAAARAAIGALADAPSDGKTYGRKDAAWAEAAPIASPTFTGTVNGITKAMVGLGNVDNTSDADKPISTATQTALNAKAPLANPTFTGTPTAPTAAVGTNTTQLATTAYVVAERAATATLTNKTLTTPVLTGTREVRVAMPANAIDLSAGNVFTKTISGATTLTVSNTPTTGNAASFILELTNAGSAAITWFSGVKWAGGTAPTLTASGVDVLGFYSHNGGTTWRGFLLSKDSK